MILCYLEILFAPMNDLEILIFTFFFYVETINIELFQFENLRYIVKK